MKKIIDVSQYQGNINWKAVKECGEVDGAILRGVSSRSGKIYVDEQFKRNYDECKKYDIPVGVYLFSYATSCSEILDEVDFFFNSCLYGRKFELPVVIDFEYQNFNERDLLTRNADILSAGLHMLEELGAYAMYYTYKSFFDFCLRSNRDFLKPYDFWLAWYKVDTSVFPDVNFYPYSIWQYCSSGIIKGIDGRVDLNFTDKDFPAIMEKNNLNDWS